MPPPSSSKKTSHSFLSLDVVFLHVEVLLGTHAAVLRMPHDVKIVVSEVEFLPVAMMHIFVWL